jgi:hypothetical protein
MDLWTGWKWCLRVANTVHDRDGLITFKCNYFCLWGSRQTYLLAFLWFSRDLKVIWIVVWTCISRHVTFGPMEGSRPIWDIHGDIRTATNAFNNKLDAFSLVSINSVISIHPSYFVFIHPSYFVFLILYWLGSGIASPTPLPHAPEARMMVVKLTHWNQCY